MPGSYYDLDDFLAEEEPVQCQTKFDFSHLSHLDPDAMFHSTVNSSRHHQHHVLPEGSKISIPLWAVRKWADLGFCRIALPVQYRLKARELIQADPASVSLPDQKSNHNNSSSNSNEAAGRSSSTSGCYYRTGHCILQLMESSGRKQADMLYQMPSNMERNVQLKLLEKHLQEAQQLREMLLQTYAGARFSQTLDWALSSVGDDVTAFIRKLSDLEKRLYYCASIAATNHQIWKLHGNSHHRSRRAGFTKKSFLPQPTASSSSNPKKGGTLRTVTPTSGDIHDGDVRPRKDKRMKMK